MQFGRRQLDLQVPQVMGILNITPDSFSDGGELLRNGQPELDAVLHRAEAMVLAGASMLDIGGESTRPGAQIVPPEVEAQRVLPVITALNSRFDVVLSLDTSNPALMTAGAELGVGLINDVRALEREGAIAAAAATGLPVCLMHMQGQPDTMQNAPAYDDVVEQVLHYLKERIRLCEEGGIDRSNIILDPGFGFGKTLEHNLHLLNQLEKLKECSLPLLIGLSRKRMLGTITGKSEKDRAAAGLAAAVIAVMKGGRIVRTHDVGATVDALKVCAELLVL